MAFPDDLLQLARELVGQTAHSDDVRLRRGISTTYYAVFHLLVTAAVEQVIVLTPLRNRVARAFDHRTIRLVCTEYTKLKPDRTGQVRLPSGDLLPAALQKLTEIVCLLQDARHQADYDWATPISHSDADTLIVSAETAFQDWTSLYNDPATLVFLVELLCRSLPRR